MAHPLEALLVLQATDRKIAKLQREIRDIPSRKGDIDKQLEGVRRRLHTAKDGLQQVNADLKQIQITVESHREKIDKYKNQQMDAQNNEQYRALLHEVAAEEKSIRDQEDIEIELMGKVEGFKKAIAEHESKLAEEEEGVSEEQEMLDERLAEVEEDLQELTEDREKKRADITPALLKRYERIFANKRDFAVVEVNDTHCGGCHMKLPPQVVNDALNPHKLVSCNYCGRLLINRR